MEIEASELLTVPEVARILRLQPSTIRAWILKRKIQYLKLGGRVFLRKADCDALIDASIVPTVEETSQQ
jgi:excisionase family DNA binding protein